MVFAYDTWAYHSKRPFSSYRNAEACWLPTTVEQLNKFMSTDKHSDTAPEDDAVLFYMLNHAKSLVGLKVSAEEPLPEPYRLVLNDYYDSMGGVALRAFYYLLLICTRESRHVHQTSFQQDYKAKFGETIANFTDTLRGMGSSGAASHLRNHPPAVSLGAYTEALEYCFFNGKFSGGYGGPAWGAVAHCLNEFVWGRFTPEMMVDTIWTLCHNNGPIFNKGMLYRNYTGELVTLLDVQRAGQIPMLLRDINKGVGYLNYQPAAAIRTRCKSLLTVLPELDKPIDWYLVEALGSNHTYSKYKSKQDQIYGVNPQQLKLQEEAKKKAQAESLAKELEAKKKLEEANKQYFFITPTQSVPKISRADVKKKLALA